MPGWSNQMVKVRRIYIYQKESLIDTFMHYGLPTPIVGNWQKETSVVICVCVLIVNRMR
jgi:hypothetical protein